MSVSGRLISCMRIKQSSSNSYQRKPWRFRLDVRLVSGYTSPSQVNMQSRIQDLSGKGERSFLHAENSLHDIVKFIYKWQTIKQEGWTKRECIKKERKIREEWREWAEREGKESTSPWERNPFEESGTRGFQQWAPTGGGSGTNQLHFFVSNQLSCVWEFSSDERRSVWEEERERERRSVLYCSEIKQQNRNR